MMAQENSIIYKTKLYVQEALNNDCSGHDWWHVYRVHQIACHIAKKEKADQLIVELAALLHDIADWKFHAGDLSAGAKLARQWLEGLSVSKHLISKVCEIIESISFKGAGEKIEKLSLEGQIVQDADRLDAIGAIGIARTFAYGGYKNRPLHHPDMEPYYHKNFTEYKKHQGTTINHFYEKLFLLKDRLNTKTAKLLAKKRHDFMQQFVQQFLQEWEFKDNE